MKATGIVRKVDELGRVVIPKELRRTMDIQEGDPLEIFVDGQNIMLRKYQPACHFCGGTEGAEHFKGKLVCANCRAELKK
jgi:AbrB family transcriptional regulator, transcriptional pleiotropic regulator of transition state genes